MHAPVAGQPWASSASNNALGATLAQQSGQQASFTSSADTVSVLFV